LTFEPSTYERMNLDNLQRYTVFREEEKDVATSPSSRRREVAELKAQLAETKAAIADLITENRNVSSPQLLR
jgi:antitoxin component of MazEF toxin-antitoxin module